TCGIAHGMGSENQAHGGSTSRELLLPFGNLHMGPCAAHHGDHQWGTRKPLALKLNLLGSSVRAFGTKHGGDDLTGRRTRISFEEDETPWRELSVIGHPRRDSQQCLDL